MNAIIGMANPFEIIQLGFFFGNFQIHFAKMTKSDFHKSLAQNASNN